MRIHSITPYSEVNGPGVRTVIHFQGCKFACPGCFNPQTHSLDGGVELTLQQVLDSIPKDVDGVTVSGGEPFLQQEALLMLTKTLRLMGYSIIVFSGFYLHEIKRLKYGNEILSNIDVLIDGRFDESQMSTNGLHGSDNQTIYCFTDRYTDDDLKPRNVEFILGGDGTLKITGFPSIKLLNEIKI